MSNVFGTNTTSNLMSVAETASKVMGLEEAVNLKKLKKEYEDNEDKNYHRENYLLLAKAFGTPAEVKHKVLLQKQTMIGCIRTSTNIMTKSELKKLKWLKQFLLTETTNMTEK